MANGDITAVKVLGRLNTQGGGFTTGGVAKNNKELVWAEITATYVSTGLAWGAVGAHRALGLQTLDFITFEVVNLNAVDNASQAQFDAQLARDEDKIYILADVDAGTLPSDGHAVLMRVFAIGDSVAPELV